MDPQRTPPRDEFESLWAPPEAGLGFGPDWSDPEAERRGLRVRLQKLQLGFASIALALILASLTTLGYLVYFFATGMFQPPGVLLGIPQWELFEESVVVFGTFIGFALIWGRWPDVSWLRRSGLLLMMGLVDVVLWAMDHATEIGLANEKIGHPWFRHCLGQALGWSEFALIAGLASGLAGRLGEPQAADYGKAARSLATTGAMVWFLFFCYRTNWSRPPVWPLHEKPLNAGSFMLFLGTMVISAIILIQSSALTMLASSSCSKRLRQMAAEDRKKNDYDPYAPTGHDASQPRSGSRG